MKEYSDDFNITDSSDEGGCFVWMGIGVLSIIIGIVLLIIF